MNIKIIILVSLISSLCGCASYGNYQPVVDIGNNQNNVNLQKDMMECRQLAEQTSNTGTEALKSGVGGAAIGAGVGALSGLIFNNPGMGAAGGAIIGATGASIYSGVSSEDQFKRSYINCMRGRGHNVIN
jgi:uncharacterized membrane protein